MAIVSDALTLVDVDTIGLCERYFQRVALVPTCARARRTPTTILGMVDTRLATALRFEILVGEGRARFTLRLTGRFLILSFGTRGTRVFGRRSCLCRFFPHSTRRARALGSLSCFRRPLTSTTRRARALESLSCFRRPLTRTTRRTLCIHV